MRYSLTDDFVKLSESKGTLHNLSHHVVIEVSNSNTKNSGILINPREKYEWVDGTPYARAIGGSAFLAAVPFVGGSGGGGGGGEGQPISQDELDNIIDSIDDF